MNSKPRPKAALKTNRPDQSLTFRSIILISLWAGLVTGLMEVLIQSFRKFGLHQLIGLGLDYIWMAPLADAMIFLTIGLLFSFYASRFTRVNSIRLLIFILVFVFGFSTIQYLPIHWLAMEILSLGIAVAGANAVQNHKTTLIKLARVSIPDLDRDYRPGWDHPALIPMAARTAVPGQFTPG